MKNENDREYKICKKKKIRLKELWLHIDEVSDCQLSVKEAPPFFKIGFVGRG